MIYISGSYANCPDGTTAFQNAEYVEANVVPSDFQNMCWIEAMGTIEENEEIFVDYGVAGIFPDALGGECVGGFGCWSFVRMAGIDFCNCVVGGDADAERSSRGCYRGFSTVLQDRYSNHPHRK